MLVAGVRRGEGRGIGRKDGSELLDFGDKTCCCLVVETVGSNDIRSAEDSLVLTDQCTRDEESEESAKCGVDNATAEHRFRVWRR